MAVGDGEVSQHLVVDGRAVCVVELPRGLRARRRGLVGRDRIEGAMLLRRCPAVHTVGMRFALDVAFLDRRMVVIDSLTMPPGRLGWPRWRARACLEAEAGAFAGWGVRRGSQLLVHTSSEEEERCR